jgi:4-amino-4-deoxy-L-arabinose transferase-like glycosyltransferase
VATRREGIEIDGITYLANALAILSDWGAINTLHPPLYSLVVAPFLSLGDDPEWTGRIVSAILGGLWVWPTLWLARAVTAERVAWTSGLLVAVMPAAVEAATRVLPEALFGLCLTTFLVVLALALKGGGLGHAALAGLLGGLSTLARPEGMGYLALAWVLLALAPLLLGAAWTRRRVVTRLAALTLVWLLVLFPYARLVRAQTGQWHWSGKAGITLRWAESVGEERPDAVVEQVITGDRPQDGPQGLLEYVAARPGQAARRAVINLHLMDKYALPGFLHTGGIALVVLGLVHLRFRRAPFPPEWFLVAAGLPLSGLLLFLVEPRYFVPFLPALCVVAGIGLARLGRREEPLGAGGLSPAGALLLAVALASFIPWIARPWLRQDPAGVEKAAGAWLRQAAGPGAVFIGRSPVIGYYAGARSIPFARRSLDELLVEGRQSGARFVIADSFRLPASRPDLLSLVGGGNGIHPGLELARIEEDRAGNRVVIYRIAEGLSP